MGTLTCAPIGVLRTPHTDLADMPIQPSGARGLEGTAEIDPAFAAGLQDLAGFSHLILLYHLHRAPAPALLVRPFLDTAERGVFATRAPCRPNPIGLSVVRLLGVTGNILRLGDVDMLDGSPLLDIKPFVPAFDAPGDCCTGWLEGRSGDERRSDGRFTDPEKQG